MSFGFKAFNWELRSCGLHGHATYRPTETDLADRMSSGTPWGEAWRCLRCGDYVLGEPSATGPADEAPIVLRGEALRDAFIMRILSIDKGVRGLFLLAVGVGILRLNGQRASIQHVLDSSLPLLSPVADRMGIALTDLAAVRWIEQALSASATTVTYVGLGVVAYAGLNLLESVGLWLMKRWGEYVAVIGTSAFLPLEIYELVEKITVFRVVAFVINAFLVAYLVYSKRLFGARGGHAAAEAARHEASLLEVELTAARPKPAAATQTKQDSPPASE